MQSTFERCEWQWNYWCVREHNKKIQAREQTSKRAAELAKRREEEEEQRQGAEAEAERQRDECETGRTRPGRSGDH